MTASASAPIIHRPVSVGTFGKMDQWGFGSQAQVWDYPTLGLRRVITSSTVGGIVYPTIEGVAPEYSEERKPYAPDQRWGQYAPTYHLPDGRRLVAVDVDGERCFAEYRLSVRQAQEVIYGVRD